MHSWLMQAAVTFLSDFLTDAEIIEWKLRYDVIASEKEKRMFGELGVAFTIAIWDTADEVVVEKYDVDCAVSNAVGLMGKCLKVLLYRQYGMDEYLDLSDVGEVGAEE